ALDLVIEPAHEEAENLRENWRKAMEQYDLDLEDFKARKNDDDPPPKPIKPVLQRLTVNDATAESLVPILNENPRGVLLVRDEMSGWVQSMNQYREGGKGADQQFWLSVWSGATVEVDRKKTHAEGPLVARKPFVAVIGGLTPDNLPVLRGDRGRHR